MNRVNQWNDSSMVNWIDIHRRNKVLKTLKYINQEYNFNRHVVWRHARFINHVLSVNKLKINTIKKKTESVQR